MRQSRLPALLVTALVALTACTAAPNSEPKAGKVGDLAAEADPDASSGGTLKMQVFQDVVEASGLDPQVAGNATSWQIMSLVYDTLVTVGPDFKPRPALADRWTQPDPRTYDFHLRPGARFSNGRLLAADDVVQSMDRLMSDKLAAFWRTQLGPVKSVTKRSDDTVRFVLKRPYSSFLAALSNINAAVLPMKEINAGKVDVTKTMLGTGPFMVSSHRQDISWEFEKNPHYWEKTRPVLDGIDVKIVPQESSRIAALRDGSADIASMANVDTPRVLQNEQSVKLVTQRTTDYWYLVLNSQWPQSKMRDPRVRKAINIAVNRKSIASAAMAGLGEPTGAVPVGLPGSCDPAELPSAKSSTEEARKLLADAGASGLSFNLTVYNSDPAISQIAQVVQQDLKAVGVDARIEKLDDGAFTDKIYGKVPGHFDAALNWYAGYADAGMVVQWWNPKAAGFTAGFIEDDAKLNGLVESVREDGGADRSTTVRDLCAEVDDNADMIPLVTRPAIIAYRSDRVSPTLYAAEGYGDLWRNVADYRLTER